MTLEKWFKSISKAVSVGSSKYRLDPRICILATASVSTASLLLGLKTNILLLASSIILLLLADGVAVLLYSLTALSPFIAFYIISGLLVQLLVVRGVDLSILTLNSCRMLVIALYSITMASMMRVSELILQLRRVSPKLALGVALAIKSFYLSVKEAQRVTEIYNSWLRGKRGLRMVMFKAELIAKTISYIALSRAIETTESLYTRQVMVGLSAYGKPERDRSKASERACRVKIVCKGN